MADDLGQLPYFEDFDSYDFNSKKLPDGWAFDGQKGFAITNWQPLVDAYSGTQTLFHSDKTNQESITYTCGFELKAGITYHLDCFVFAPGMVLNPPKRYEHFRFTSGKAQNRESQINILGEFKGRRFPEWEKLEMTFVPQESGIYYFAIITEEIPNIIQLDNFTIYGEDNPFATIARFNAIGGIWSASTTNSTNGLRYLYPGQSISLINESTYATHYDWTTTGGELVISKENVELFLDESGKYDISLKATNVVSEDQKTKDINILMIGDEEISDIISNKTEIDPLMHSETEVPSSSFNCVNGVNPYYNSIAEQFIVPEEMSLSINSVSMMLYMYKLSGRNKNVTVNFVIYGDNDGYLDDTKVFGSYSTTMKDAFGEELCGVYYGDTESSDIARTIKFDKPIDVKGSFYVSIEIGSSFGADAANCFAILGCQRSDNVTSSFAKINSNGSSLLELSQGWYNMTELPDPFTEISKTGLSFYIAPGVTFHKIENNPPTENGIEEIYDSNLKLYPTIVRSSLTIETDYSLISNVTICDIAGSTIYNADLKCKKISIDTNNWSIGTYLIYVRRLNEVSMYKVIKN